MRTQFFPDTITDSLNVSVNWKGAGAEDIDNAIVQLLEPALQNVEGVTSTNSVSYEGRTRISLEFEPGWEMSKAADDAKTAVNAVTDLPESADDPVVYFRSWRDRVTDVIISGPVSVDHLGRFADEFAVNLFSRGVALTSIRGVEAPKTVILVPESELVRNNTSLAEISHAVGEEAKADPTGEVGGFGASQGGHRKTVN